MKKVLCLIIALALIMIPTLCVSAETTENINFGVSNVVAEDKYDVTLRISTDYLCSGVQAVVKFDSANITCTETDTNEIDVLNGTVKVSKVASEDISGKWIDLKFTSKTPVYAKDFSISKVKGVKAVGGEIAVNESSAKFTYGDLNGDNNINIIDFIRLKKMSIDILDYSPEADIDLSGDHNSSDLVAMRRFLLFSF